MFRILTIDGGGFRGVYSAHVLKRIEEEYNVPLHNQFDLIVGTSTGSIIAAALACEKKASDISKMYDKHGKSIFRKRCLCRFGLFGSRYKPKRLKKVLNTFFGDTTLGNVQHPLDEAASPRGGTGFRPYWGGKLHWNFRFL